MIYFSAPGQRAGVVYLENNGQMKRLFCRIIAAWLAALCLCWALYAAEGPDPYRATDITPTPAQHLALLQEEGHELAASLSTQELLFKFLVFVGACRLLIKPALALAHAYTAQTQTDKDDQALARLENSSGFKAALFVLDWIASIKLKR